MIAIVHAPSEGEPYYVINKPRGLPSAPLNALDTKPNALGELLALNPSLKKVSGRGGFDHGLLHRLDREAGGLLMVAARDDFFSYILRIQSDGGFIKGYEAVCRVDKKFFLTPLCGLLSREGVFFGDYPIETRFRSYGPRGERSLPVTENDTAAAIKKCRNNRFYSTHISEIRLIEGERAFVRAWITAGARHQVRSHLSFIGLPIMGDRLYNSEESYLSKSIGDSCPASKKSVVVDKKSARLNESSETFASTEGHPLQFFSTRLEWTNPSGERKVYKIGCAFDRPF